MELQGTYPTSLAKVIWAVYSLFSYRYTIGLVFVQVVVRIVAQEVKTRMS